MNSNLIRTVLSIAAIVLSVIPAVTGCVADALGRLDCSASWLPPQYSGLLVAAVLIVNQILKAADVGLVKPTAQISTTGAPGTVSPSAVVPK